jgi:lysozyme
VNTSPQGRAFIEEFEGLYLHAYNDGVGVCTIGYGHTDAAGPPKVHYGDVITREQADAYLAADMSKVDREVSTLVRVPLTQNQHDALSSFHFNTGGLGRSTLLKRLNQGDYVCVPGELMKWNKGGGKVMAGLTRRRAGEGAMWKANDHHAGQIVLAPASPVRQNQAPATQVTKTASATHGLLWWIARILLSLIAKDPK